jgi:hypothetical protein
LQYQYLSVEVFLFGGDSFFDIIKLSPLAEDAGGIASMLKELRLRCAWSRRHFRQLDWGGFVVEKCLLGGRAYSGIMKYGEGVVSMLHKTNLGVGNRMVSLK